MISCLLAPLILANVIKIWSFLSLCEKLGVPIKVEKTVQPSTVITIYGIEVDSDEL